MPSARSPTILGCKSSWGPGRGLGRTFACFTLTGGSATQIAGPLGSFFAYDAAFLGGVFVAAGNYDGLPGDELITGSGEGAVPHVKAFAADGSLVASFFAFAPGFLGGTYVAAGDLDGDLRDEIIVGAAAGAGPNVRAFRNEGFAREIASFFAFDPSFTGGVRVASTDIDNDGLADILCGAGPGMGPLVTFFDGQTFSAIDSFFAFDPAFHGGVFVG